MPLDSLRNSTRHGYRRARRLAHFSIAAALLAAPSAWSQGSPAGHWEGTASMGSQQVGLSLDLAKNAASEWEASMGAPAMNATGLVVADLTVSGNSVRFTGVELQMAKFDLTLGADGAMKGTLSNAQGPVPIEFRRTGEAKVELIASNPAVSKELEGDWEGTLQGPGQAFPLVFHFKNRPDKTVAASIDSPAMNAMGLPLDHVRQTGEKVEFGIKIAEASFRGALNKEGTELAGQLVHEGGSTPFTLRKKQ
jgi:hypothetical protein